MKTNLTISISLSLTFAVTAKAQLVTITATHQIPAIGDTVHYVDANTFGFDPMGVGTVTTKVWDESGLLNAGTTKDFYYIDPTTIPVTLGKDTFPNANIARGESGTAGYFYYQNTANDIDRLGWFIDTSHYGAYKDGTFATEFHFPITAGLAFASTYHGNYARFNFGEDSVRINSGSVHINADMQGQLILPTGSFNSALRLHVTESFNITSYILGGIATDNLIQDDYYYWFVDTIKQPLLIYGTTSEDGTIQSTVLRYQPDSILGINELDVVNERIYPDPSNGIFNIECSDFLVGNEQLEIYNVLGERVNYTKIKKQSSIEINISNVPKGIYFIKIYSSHKIRTEKIILQ